jgi:hypothetical protein
MKGEREGDDGDGWDPFYCLAGPEGSHEAEISSHRDGCREFEFSQPKYVVILIAQVSPCDFNLGGGEGGGCINRGGPIEEHTGTVTTYTCLYNVESNSHFNLSQTSF